MPSTSSSASARPGRRCSTTSSRSPSRRSSSRTTSRSSGRRCARTRGTSSAGSSSIVVLVALNIVGDPGVGAAERRPRRRRLHHPDPPRRARVRARLQPARSCARTSTGGSRRRWSAVLPRDPGRDAGLHGDRDRLEPGGGGTRPGSHDPELDQARRGRGLHDLLHAAAGSRSRRCRSRWWTGSTRRCSASRRRKGFANDPVLGVVENLGLHGVVLSAAKVYVGILAATILFIATNAGVIGASRITYAMASYRQLPSIFRTPPPALQDAVALDPRLRGDRSRSLVILPGQTAFLGTIYAFGATLLVHRRARVDHRAASPPRGGATSRTAHGRT